MGGKASSYVEKNVTADSLKTLGVNYFVAIDMKGRVVLDRGFDFSGDEPKPITLFQNDQVVPGALSLTSNVANVQSGLMYTPQGLVAVGYSPILRSDRSGAVAGTLVLGRIIKSDGLKSTTKVDFEIRPRLEQIAPTASTDQLDKITDLSGLDGQPIATLISHTGREITQVGERTILAAMAFLLAGAALLILALGFALRKIALRRIETMRFHLMRVADTGNLEAMTEDGKADELSDTLVSFNMMAAQLADLRDKLRWQDYQHGAADQAAGLLHNVRNAVSPIAALAWNLAKDDDAGWKQNLSKAVQELKEPVADPERRAKVTQFVVASAMRLLEEVASRREDLKSMASMVRHVENILKDQDVLSRAERVSEEFDVGRLIAEAVNLISRRTGVRVECQVDAHSIMRGHKIPLEQVFANLFVNAAEAIEAAGHETGTVRVHLSREMAEQMLKIVVADDGVGVTADNLPRLFEKGYTTKTERAGGLGLHWCANAVNAMGGRLTISSEGAGKGTCVTITLPVGAEMLKDAA
jgi:signal transduction histidine kinase